MITLAIIFAKCVTIKPTFFAAVIRTKLTAIRAAIFKSFIFTKQPSLEQPLNFWQAQLSGKSRKFDLFELHLEASHCQE